MDVEVKEIKTEEPKMKTGNHPPFVEIPIRFKERPITLELKKCCFKIFKNENGFSLGINLDESPPEIKIKFQEIQEQIRKLAMENQPAVKKLNWRVAKFSATDFNLIKTDRSEMEKAWGKLWTNTKGDISVPFSKFGEGEVGKRNSIRFDPHDHIGEKLTGHVIFRISRIFCGNCQSISCSINSVFVTKFHGNASAFDNFEDTEEDW